MEQVAEASARGLEGAAGAAVGEAPGGLGGPGASCVARVEGGASGGEDEGVGDDEVDFLSRGEAGQAAAEGVDEGARLPRRAGVAGGGDDGYVVAGVGLEGGVQLGDLGVVDAVLAADLAGWAEGDDAALGGA